MQAIPLILLLSGFTPLTPADSVSSLRPGDVERMPGPALVVMDTFLVEATSLNPANCQEEEKILDLWFEQGSGEDLLTTLISADRVQIFRIDPTNVWNSGDGPQSLAYEPAGRNADLNIVARGPELTPMLALAVAQYIGEEDHYWFHCPANKMTCAFFPDLALRFFRGDSWLDVLVSDCLFLAFHASDGGRVGFGTLDPDSRVLKDLLDPVVQAPW